MSDQSGSALHLPSSGGIKTSFTEEKREIFPEFDLVLGTDTRVGKTVVSAILLRELASGKKTPAYLKPVLTGGQGEDSDSDPSRCREMSGLAVSPFEWMYAFPDPIDPMTAATRSGVSIDPGLIRRKGIL